MRTLVIVCILAALLPWRAAAAEKYTWEDLQVLAEEGAWAELLDHARDIRPSQRKGEWKTWVENGALAAVKAAGTEGDAAATFALAEDLLTRFAALKSSSGFMAARAEAGLKNFRRCFAERRASLDACLDGLTSFAASQAATPGLALKAAAVAHRHVNEPYVMPLYLLAAQDKGDPSACAAPGLRRATLRSLVESEPKASVVAARRVAFELCWPDLKAPVLAAFSDSPLGSSFQANTCGPLTDRGLLNGLRADICKHMAEKGELFPPS
ncbi:MAG: hypothetical protein H6907_16340 [Hyphomicrobiales bacterium]|nr:hypothetical protein [Hyphomicrobiales bacterium]MCP5373296.1 hypothetical protein [Hyphomicrobiales bacterium]